MKVKDLLEKTTLNAVQIRDAWNKVVITISPNIAYEKYLSTWLLEREIKKIATSVNATLDVYLEKDDKNDE